MHRISFPADYLWLRAMDIVCSIRGHKLTTLLKHRLCLRCYRVEGVDFPSVTSSPSGVLPQPEALMIEIRRKRG